RRSRWTRAGTAAPRRGPGRGPSRRAARSRPHLDRAAHDVVREAAELEAEDVVRPWLFERVDELLRPPGHDLELRQQDAVLVVDRERVAHVARGQLELHGDVRLPHLGLETR